MISPNLAQANCGFAYTNLQLGNTLSKVHRSHSIPKTYETEGLPGNLNIEFKLSIFRY